MRCPCETEPGCNRPHGVMCHYAGMTSIACSISSQGQATTIFHDGRLCVAVCGNHATWRETTSRMFGHSATCDNPRVTRCVVCTGHTSHRDLCIGCNRYVHDRCAGDALHPCTAKPMSAEEVCRVRAPETESESPAILDRYRQCALRIWKLFPSDPLDNHPAHFYIERLEALLDLGLLAPSSRERNVR
jgi:hypothetical protein